MGQFIVSGERLRSVDISAYQYFLVSLLTFETTQFSKVNCGLSCNDSSRLIQTFTCLSQAQKLRELVFCTLQGDSLPSFVATLLIVPWEVNLLRKDCLNNLYQFFWTTPLSEHPFCSSQPRLLDQPTKYASFPSCSSEGRVLFRKHPYLSWVQQPASLLSDLKRLSAEGFPNCRWRVIWILRRGFWLQIPWRGLSALSIETEISNLSSIWLYEGMSIHGYLQSLSGK